MFAVTVTFRIKPQHCNAFGTAVQANAEASREREPGCRRFDVCTDPDRPDEIFLYELYDSAAAFDDHHETEHFVSFAEKTAHMVEDKQVMTFRSVS